MTHWDDERDARWVQMLRECKVPSSEWVVLGFEAPRRIHLLECFHQAHERSMQLTEEEQRYLQYLTDQMTFEEMAVKLGWTYCEVVDFGDHFFGRDFEERKKDNPQVAYWNEECNRYRLLLMRA